MKALLIFPALLLAGCSSLKNPFADGGPYSGINPPRIHVDQDRIGTKKPSDLESTATTPPQVVMARGAHAAELDPINRYYEAMDLARKTEDLAVQAGRIRGSSREQRERDTLHHFGVTGITVVDAMCMRWFHGMMEAQIRRNYSQSSQNIIKNLGTTLLGLAAANKYIVGGYGATMVAADAVQQSYSDAFLLAPNANKIKSHVLMALADNAKKFKDKLLDKEESLTYSEIYTELERHADICTQHTAREIMNTALDQTKTTVGAPTDGGRLTTTPTSAGDAQAQRQVKEEIKRLTEQNEKTVKQIEAQAGNISKQAAANRALEKKLEEQSASLRNAQARLESESRRASELEDEKRRLQSDLDAAKQQVPPKQ